MKAKASLPLSALAGSNPSPLLEAYFEINHLKHLYRQGWLRRGLPAERCESVAEHVFGMAMLAWWLVDDSYPDLDRDKVIRLVLVHEIGEVYTGDIIPSDNIPQVEKHRLERKAIEQVVGKLAHGEAYINLWEEYEHNDTPEARLVHQIDRLEMVFQASVYERYNLGDMSEFFASGNQGVQDEKLREILRELEVLRK
jgi:putative hydrolases of HD superfamily